MNLIIEKNLSNWISTIVYLLSLTFSIITFSQEQIDFSNPFNNSKIFVFSDNKNIIQTKNKNIYIYSIQRKQNLRIVFNFDSVLKLCYQKNFGSNFDSAWRIRTRLKSKELELSIYNFNSTASEKYFICRFYYINLDTFYQVRLLKTPSILILKTDSNFKLVDFFCTQSTFIKGIYCINPVPNSDIYFSSDTSILLPLYHPAYTTIRQGKYLNESLDECIGKFKIKRGSVILIQSFKINKRFNNSKDINGFKIIDHVFGSDNHIYAFDSKIPIIYDVINDKILRLYPNNLDSSALLKRIENDYYEIICGIHNDSIISVIYRIDGSIYLANYNLNNNELKSEFIDIPLGNFPLFWNNNSYYYSIISKDEIHVLARRFY